MRREQTSEVREDLRSRVRALGAGGARRSRGDNRYGNGEDPRRRYSDDLAAEALFKSIDAPEPAVLLGVIIAPAFGLGT